LKNMEHNFTGQLPLRLDFVIKNTWHLHVGIIKW
jgi:hypothetical protein